MEPESYKVPIRLGVVQNYMGPFFKAVYPSYPAPRNALQWPDWLSLKGPLLPARGCPRSFELHPIRFYEIDLLRFLAALSVVLYHYTYHGYNEGDYSPVQFALIRRFTKLMLRSRWVSLFV